MRRILTACLTVLLPLVPLAAEDSQPEDTRPACGSHNQGQLWPEAANHDSKLLSRLMRCGQLFLCVRGTWHYHWEAPSIRLDQLAHGAKFKATKPTTCEAESVVNSPKTDSAATDGTR